jgi:hypothetical protein
MERTIERIRLDGGNMRDVRKGDRQEIQESEIGNSEQFG